MFLQEHLLLQGVHYGTAGQNKLPKYGHEFLQNLAGNAFNAHSNAAVLITAKVTIVHLFVRARSRALAMPSSVGQR